MIFNYKARDEKENIQSGTIESSSRSSALSALEERGYYVFSITEEEAPFYKKGIKLPQKISQIEVVTFSRQLAIMIESKVTVVDALRIILSEIEKRRFREKIEDISKRVEDGTPFSEALEKHSDIFPSFYSAMVKSGEASGRLSEALSYIADQMESNYTFKRKLLGAMTYPALIIFVFSGVMAFLFLYIVPELQEMLAEFDAEMPMITRIVIAISEFFQNWWWALGITFVIGIIGFLQYIKTDDGKDIFDIYMLEIPILGSFFKKIYLFQIAESLSTLISSGLSIIKALEVTEDIVGNNIYKNILAETREEVKGGREISEIIKKHPKYFPSLFVQMMMIGENSGQIQTALSSVVKLYKEEVERKMETYVKLIEPALIVLLGGMIGGLVLSILLPIYTIGLAM